jgi:pyruvate dehydrogenase E2 component (dihydrolipoamide acetyltransferase)
VSFLELPRMGETMEEGELLTWMKKPGERVKRGETVAEIQTDKIVAEMPALEDFVLEEYLVQEGDTIKVGQALARVTRAGESSSGGQPSPPTPLPQGEGSKTVSSQPERVPVGVGASRDSVQGTTHAAPLQSAIPAGQPTTNNLVGRVRASPAARRVARELEVRLENVMGTGPRGRVTTDDVRAAARSSSVDSKNTVLDDVSRDQKNTVLDGVPVQDEFHKFTRIEIATGKATSQSKREMPHFYVRMKADLMGFMRGLEMEKARGLNVTINDGLVKAVALALREHPRLNAVLEGDGVKLLAGVHIGVITATSEGLVTSVVRDADSQSLSQINARVKEVKARASAGRARSEDISGATFCISNLGMFGVEEFSAIILPPNVAILAVGAAQDEVIAIDGAIRIAKTVRLTVSADHRAVDGVEVALFLQSLRRMLENPNGLFQGGSP